MEVRDFLLLRIRQGLLLLNLVDLILKATTLGWLARVYSMILPIPELLFKLSLGIEFHLMLNSPSIFRDLLYRCKWPWSTRYSTWADRLSIYTLDATIIYAYLDTRL